MGKSLEFQKRCVLLMDEMNSILVVLLVLEQANAMILKTMVPKGAKIESF